MRRFPIKLNLFRTDDIPFVFGRNSLIYDRLYYSTIYDLTSIILNAHWKWIVGLESSSRYVSKIRLFLFLRNVYTDLFQPEMSNRCNNWIIAHEKSVASYQSLQVSLLGNVFTGVCPSFFSRGARGEG